MKKSKMQTVCPKCGRSFDRLTKHHIFPQQLVKRLRSEKVNAEKNHFYIKLCRDCHDCLHDIISNKKKLTLNDCALIAWKFLMGDTLYF